MYMNRGFRANLPLAISMNFANLWNIMQVLEKSEIFCGDTWRYNVLTKNIPAQNSIPILFCGHFNFGQIYQSLTLYLFISPPPKHQEYRNQISKYVYSSKEEYN